MTYEEENKKLEEKLISINIKIEETHTLIQHLNSCKCNIRNKSGIDIGKSYFAKESEIGMIDMALQNAQYKLVMLEEIKQNTIDVLKESPRQRKISNLICKIPLDKLPEFPQKVYDGGFLSKPMYSISDGCANWMAIFCIICCILVFIVLAITGSI